MPRLIEIRSYRLKPGTTAAFHEVVTTAALPLLREWGMDVVAHGPSPHEADRYFLVRAFADLQDLKDQEERFYGSPAWRQGPREAVVSRIEDYLDTLLWLSPESIEDLRRSNAAPA